MRLLAAWLLEKTARLALSVAEDAHGAAQRLVPEPEPARTFGLHVVHSPNLGYRTTAVSTQPASLNWEKPWPSQPC